MIISIEGTMAIVQNLRNEGQNSRADYLEQMDANYWQMYEALQRIVDAGWLVDTPTSVQQEAQAALDAAGGE